MTATWGELLMMTLTTTERLIVIPGPTGERSILPTTTL